MPSLLQVLSLLLLCTATRNLLVSAEDYYLNNKQLVHRLEEYQANPDETARKYGVLGDWDLQNVTSLRNVFSFMEDFNDPSIARWNVSSVTDFSSMFWTANSFDADLGAWDVRQAQTMACMFCGATSYTGKGLDQWSNKLQNVEDMFNMFEGTAISKETIDLSGWDVIYVTNFRQMFKDTPNYKTNLCWNVSVLARTTDMFENSDSCFDKKCVKDHQIEDANCGFSGAASILAGRSDVFGVIGLTGVVGLLSILLF